MQLNSVSVSEIYTTPLAIRVSVMLIGFDLSRVA